MADFSIWAAMLAKLHQPWGDAEKFLREIPGWTSLREPMHCWIAWDDDGQPVGMVDARIRNYAEGAPDLVAAYVEDLWVDEAHRRRGVATALLAAVERWAVDQGANWIGSDTEFGNELSEAWHKAAGFTVQDRLVVFGKPLPR